MEGLLFSLLPIREAQVLMLAKLGLVMETVIQNLFSRRKYRDFQLTCEHFHSIAKFSCFGLATSGPLSAEH